MFAELYRPGRRATATGRGGSMHINDLDHRHARRQRHRRRGASRSPSARRSPTSTATTAASPCPFFGDGARNIGAFHEAANMAAVLEAAGRLRLREQRLRRVHAPQSAPHAAHRRRRPGRSATACPSEICDGMDAVAVRQAAQRAVERARARRAARRSSRPRPTATTTTRASRACGVPYRTEEEVEAWKAARRDRAARGPRGGRRASSTPRGIQAVWDETRAEIDRTRSRSPRPAPDPDPADCSPTSTRLRSTMAADHHRAPRPRDPHADLRQGLQRRPSRQVMREDDERLRRRRGRGRLRRRLPHVRRAARRVRAPPRGRHADLRGGHRRARRRRRRPRPAPRRRPDVHGLPRRLPRPGGQPGRQDEVHVRRQGHGCR